MRVQALERSIDCLMALSQQPCSLGEVTQMTGLPKGTVHRLLTSLGYRGLVVRDPLRNVYMLGPGLFGLVQGAVEGMGLFTRLATPALNELWEKTSESVLVHSRMGTERVCIQEIQSPYPVRYTAAVGSTAPLHVGSASKVLLTFCSDHDRERLLTWMRLDPLTDHTITDIDSLRAELELTRARGWASSTGERVPGGSAISVPIHLPGGLVLSLSVMGPADRLTPEIQLNHLDDLLRTAAAVAAVAENQPQLLP